LEGLAASVESCEKVVRRALPSLRGLRELQVSFDNDRHRDADHDFGQLDKLLTATRVSGAPLSVLRVGPGTEVSGFDDDKAVAKAAALLIESGRLSYLEMRLGLQEEISAFIRPIFAALQSSDAACGVRAGSRLTISASVQMWGFLEREIAFECEALPSAPSGGGSVRLTLIDMGGIEEEGEFEGENDMFGECLNVIIAFVRQQPLVREVVFCATLFPGLEEEPAGPFKRMLAAWRDCAEPLRLELWSCSLFMRPLVAAGRRAASGVKVGEEGGGEDEFGEDDDEEGLGAGYVPRCMKGATGSVEWMLMHALPRPRQL
jgi:hypothetical protein